MIDSVGRFEGSVPGDRWRSQRESDLAASGYEPAHVRPFQRGARGYMFSRILGVPLLAVVAQGRAATIKGTIVLNEVGGQLMANVQIIDSARTGGPWASGSDGGYARLS